MVIWTVGHSTRPLEELLAALRARRIQAVVDVRSFPQSRRYPQFHRENLQKELPQAGVAYHWMGPALGGYRKKGRTKSPHIALRSRGFRNYADHMQSKEFQHGVKQLLNLARKERTATMCAERLWWRCHRSLISDYLSGVRGLEVVHILDAKKTEPHRLHKAARVAGGRLVYDVGETGELL